MRLIHNTSDDVSLERIINVPRRGIGNKTLLNLMEQSTINGKSLYDSINGGKELLFKNMIEELIKIKDTVPLTEFIDLVLDKTGIKDEYIKEKTLEADIRLENLEEFKSVAKAFEEENGVISLEDFLLNVSLISDNSEVKEFGNTVNLMTLHAVKGLEFDYVFLVGMEENLFPHINCLESDSSVEEERRLCYVGITRCKKKLFLTNSRMRLMYGTDQVNPVSRFILEIDSSLLDNQMDKCFEKNNKIDYNITKEEAKEVINSNYKEIDNSYKVGDFVYHENFGAGTVVEIIPNKDPKRTLLKIAFKLPFGIKTLLYNHKNLRKV